LPKRFTGTPKSLNGNSGNRWVGRTFNRLWQLNGYKPTITIISPIALHDRVP
jgi:hypothetical protein